MSTPQEIQLSQIPIVNSAQNTNESLQHSEKKVRSTAAASPLVKADEWNQQQQLLQSKERQVKRRSTYYRTVGKTYLRCDVTQYICLSIFSTVIIFLLYLFNYHQESIAKMIKSVMNVIGGESTTTQSDQLIHADNVTND